ncbi:MAG: glycosyltransferase family 2 protein [Planctomycetota bacterium]
MDNELIADPASELKNKVLLEGAGNVVPADATKRSPSLNQGEETTHASAELPDQSAFLARTVVIIPARNEEDSIAQVLDDLPNVGLVIVVDNGSTDSTARIAEAHGATVVKESTPGYGQACWTGMQYLESQAPRLPFSPVYVAFLDADYSDHPNLLPMLVSPIHDGDCDFVLGSRLLGQREAGAMPAQSVYGNKLAVFLIRLFWAHRFTDLGPFRVIHRDCLNELNMVDRNFGWTVEMQIKAVESRLRIREIPVPYRKRIGTSKISGTVSGTIRAGYKILYTIAKYRWLAGRS